MKILFLTAREIDYPRNDLMHKALAQIGDVQVFAPARRKSILFSSVQQSLRALPFLLGRRFDLVFTGFYGHLLMLPVGLLTRMPVLFDAYLSTYDTLCLDRQVFSPGSLPGKLALWLDRTSCGLSDQVLLDTDAQAAFFREVIAVPAARLNSIFVGADEHLFYPREAKSATRTVLFYGSYLPVHGVEVILRAASLLNGNPSIRFTLIGDGQKFNAARQMAGQLGLDHVDFLPPVPLQRLPEYIQEAAVCLGGHFGPSDKAGRVIAGKTFQCLAMAKATIVGDNPANRELLTHGFDAWMCPMNQPAALAAAIEQLMADEDLRIELGRHARETFLQRASYSVLSPQIQAVALRTVNGKKDPHA